MSDDEQSCSTDDELMASFTCTLLEQDNARRLVRKVRRKDLTHIDNKCPDDFIFLKQIGEGAYSTVYLGREFNSGHELAIKVVQKEFVKRHQKLAAVIREKNVLASLTYAQGGHPFVTRLYCTFQDSERLYFVMDLAQRGELLQTLNRLGSFDVSVTRFFASEILTALEFIHKCGIVHRDVKPENILIKHDGHIMMTDFGSSQITGKNLFIDYENEAEEFEKKKKKQRSEDSGGISDRSKQSSFGSSSDLDAYQHTRRATFVGTAQYVSPEMLRGDEIGPSCDFWALGSIIFQMLSGQAPFRAVNDYHLMNKIQKLDYIFPEGFPLVPKDLVKKLLILNPHERIGSEDINDLKNHPFFYEVDWKNILNVEPPELHPYLPATFGEPEFYSDINVEPGLDKKAMNRLMNMSLKEMGPTITLSLDDDLFATPVDTPNDLKIFPRADKCREISAREKKLEKQRKENPYHLFVQNNLILRSGLIDKKKGLFARRRMFLLTEGPHLFYVDPNSMELKGEVPWSPCMRTEVKNFRTFFVHTPNRIYYLFDPERRAVEWCQAIEQLKLRYAAKITESYTKAVKDGTFGFNKFKKSNNYFGDKKKEKKIKKEKKDKDKKGKKEEKKKKLSN